MLLLRWLALLALAFWVGGLVALGSIGAPTAFSVLQAHDPSGGRQLAGLVFGAILGRFQYAAWGAGLILLASIGLRAALGPRPRRFGLRMWVAAAMLAASVASVFVVTPRIEALRASTPGPVAALVDGDARKVAFGRWHGVSSGLMLMTVLGGLALLWAEAGDE